MSSVADAFRLHLTRNGNAPTIAKTWKKAFEKWKTAVCPDYKDSEWPDVLAYMKRVKWVTENDLGIHMSANVLPPPKRRTGMLEERTWSKRGIVEPVMTKKRTFRQAMFYEKFEEMKRAAAKKKKKLMKTQKVGEDIYTKLKKKQNRVYIPKGVPRKNLSKSLQKAIEETNKTRASSKRGYRSRRPPRQGPPKYTDGFRFTTKPKIPADVRPPPKAWQPKSWRELPKIEDMIKPEVETIRPKRPYNDDHLIKREKDNKAEYWNKRGNNRKERSNSINRRFYHDRERPRQPRSAPDLFRYNTFSRRESRLDTRLRHGHSRQYDKVRTSRRNLPEVKRENQGKQHTYDDHSERRERQDYISCNPRRRY